MSATDLDVVTDVAPQPFPPIAAAAHVSLASNGKNS